MFLARQVQVLQELELMYHLLLLEQALQQQL